LEGKSFSDSRKLLAVRLRGELFLRGVAQECISKRGAAAFICARNIPEHTIPIVASPRPPRRIAVSRLLLVEIYRLSSFLGNDGASRVVKTFSLSAAGEKTKISVKTYTRSSSEARQASSILDSFTSASAKDFETTVAREQASKTGYNEPPVAMERKVALSDLNSSSASSGMRSGRNSPRRTSSGTAKW
jgi:hypothetical protein